MNKHLVHILLGLCLMMQVSFLFSCSEDWMQYWTDTPIRLAATNENRVETRATTEDIQGSCFDIGAKIYTYIPVTGAMDATTSLGTLEAPLVYEAQEAEERTNALVLTDGSSIYYPAGDEVKINIYALHPTKDPFTTRSFSVKDNQVSDEHYRASDLMYASVINQFKTSQIIHLQFAHEMSKLIINTEGKNDVRIKKVILKGFKKTIAVNPAPEDPQTELLGTTSDVVDITVIDESDKSELPQKSSGAVLFPPQTIHTDFIEVETNLGTAIFNISEKKFEKGRQYTVNLAISSLNIGEDNKKIITNWEGAGTVTVAAAGSTGFTFDGDIGPYTYNRSAHEPNKQNDGLTVLDDTTPLTEGTDYTLDYYNNINAGSALVVAVGMGTKYEGFTAVKSFTINQAPFDMVYRKHGGTSENPDVTMEYVYGGTVDNPLLLNTGSIYDPAENVEDGSISYSSSDKNVAEVSGDGTVTLKGTGITIITATMDGEGNYQAGSTSYILKVNKKKFDPESDPSIEVGFVGYTGGDKPSYTYDGDPKTPEVFVNIGGKPLTLSTEENDGGDYTVRYTNNENAGEATVTITGTGKYDSSTSMTLHFDIAKANTEINMTSANKTIDLGLQKAYDMSYENALGAPGSYTCTATTQLNPAKTGITVKYESGNPDIVSVDAATGKVTPKKVGGPVKIYAYVADNSPNYTNEKVSTVNITVEQMTFFWDCTLKMVTWELPKTAYYTFELVGGGGGCDGSNGGCGGIVRAKSKSQLEKDTPVYIFVGGGGSNEGGKTTLSPSNSPTVANYWNYRGSGGWNGGGHAGPSGSSGGGGGASDIRIGGRGCGTTTRPTQYSGTPPSGYGYAVWTTYGYDEAGNPDAISGDHRVLVAGGGGGASNGEQGGGHAGVAGAGLSGTAWKGQDKTSDDGGGGGGGYRGGSAGGDSKASSTGGSNYVNTGGTYPFEVCKSKSNTEINGVSTNGPNWNFKTQTVDYFKKWNGWIIASYSYE